MLDAEETSDRLGFQLPSFTRVAWSSDAARDVWAPRIERLRALGPELEWRAVVAGIRACAVIPAPPASANAESPWVIHGLTSEPLEGNRLLVGRPDDLAAFALATDAGDEEAIGRLLGHPDCCTRFYRRLWVDERSLDPTWGIAAATTESLERDTDPVGETLSVTGVPQANLLWKWLGLRPVSHTPCRFDCPETVARANAVWALRGSWGSMKRSAG